MLKYGKYGNFSSTYAAIRKLREGKDYLLHPGHASAAAKDKREKVPNMTWQWTYLPFFIIFG